LYARAQSAQTAQIHPDTGHLTKPVKSPAMSFLIKRLH